MNFLRKIISIILIFSFSFFEVGQSIRLTTVFSQEINGNSSITSTVTDAGSSKLEGETAFAVNRWINTVALLTVSAIAILVGKTCFNSIKQKAGVNCGITSWSLGAAGLMLLGGFISSWYQFNEKSFSKIDLKNIDDGTKNQAYQNLCQGIRKEGINIESFQTDNELLQAISDKGLNIPTGATRDSIKLFCNQAGALEVQSSVLENMISGLDWEFGFLIAAEVAFIVSGVNEYFEYRKMVERKTKISNFLIRLGNVVDGFEKMVKEQLEKDSFRLNLAAVAPCQLSLLACRNNIEKYKGDDNYYFANASQPIALNSQMNQPPICGKLEEGAKINYTNLIGSCIHASFACDMADAHLIKKLEELTKAETDCEIKEAAGQAQAQTKFEACKEENEKTKLELDRLQADQTLRKEFRKLKTMGEQAQFAVNHFKNTGVVLAKKWKVTDAHIRGEDFSSENPEQWNYGKYKVWLLDETTWPKIKHCIPVLQPRSCTIIHGESAKKLVINETQKLIKSWSGTLKNNLQEKYAIEAVAQDAAKSTCTLDEFKKKMVEAFEKKEQITQNSIIPFQNNEPYFTIPRNNLGFMRNLIFQPFFLFKTSVESKKDSGGGCEMACADGTKPELPQETGFINDIFTPDSKIFLGIDQSSWDQIFKILIEDSMAKNEESSINNQNWIASLIGIFGIGAAAVTILFSKVGEAQKSFHYSPVQRASWLGGLSLLVGAAITSNRIARSSVSTNLENLNKIIDKFKNNDNGESVDDENDNGNPSNPRKPKKTNNKEPQESNINLSNGMTNSGRRAGKSSGSSGAGKSFSVSGLCLKCNRQKINIGQSASGQSSSNSTGNNRSIPGEKEVLDVANQFESGNLTNDNSSALAAKADLLARKKGDVQNFLSAAKNSLNAVLQKAGFKPLDFKKMENLAYNQMMSPLKNSTNPQIQEALKGNPLLASLPSNMASDYQPTKLELPDTDDYNYSSSSNYSSGGDSFEPETPKTAEEIQANNQIEELDIKMDSINNRSDVNIFKIISKRYFRSAYPVFFEKK